MQRPYEGSSAVGTVASETTADEGAVSGTYKVCTTEGCQLRAAHPFAKCCGFCLRAHSWACLSRHTQSDQEAAEQHQQRSRQRRARPTADDTANRAIKEEPTRAAQNDFGKRPISWADEPQSRRRQARHAAEVVVNEPTAAEPTISPKTQRRMR